MYEQGEGILYRIYGKIITGEHGGNGGKKNGSFLAKTGDLTWLGTNFLLLVPKTN